MRRSQRRAAAAARGPLAVQRSAAAAARGGAASGACCRVVVFFYFLYFVERALLPVLDPVVISYPITVDFDPTGVRTVGDGVLEPMVMTHVGVVVFKNKVSEIE